MFGCDGYSAGDNEGTGVLWEHGLDLVAELCSSMWYRCKELKRVIQDSGYSTREQFLEAYLASYKTVALATTSKLASKSEGKRFCCRHHLLP